MHVGTVSWTTLHFWLQQAPAHVRRQQGAPVAIVHEGQAHVIVDVKLDEHLPAATRQTQAIGGLCSAGALPACGALHQLRARTPGLSCRVRARAGSCVRPAHSASALCVQTGRWYGCSVHDSLYGCKVWARLRQF